MSRVLIVVTHLLGAGHLTRASALARAFMRAGYEVTVVTGGMPTRQWVVEGLAVVQLPPVRTQGFDFKTLLNEDGSTVGPSGERRPSKASRPGVSAAARAASRSSSPPRRPPRCRAPA